MCDDGRFGWKYVHSEQRLRAPVMRQDGRVTSQAWEQILPALRSALGTAIKAAPSRFIAVISPWATVEEAYLLATFLKAQSPDVKLGLGPVRVEGDDDHYPKTVTGVPPAQVKFTIHAEKAPNRRGVEAVLQHVQGEVIGFDTIVQQLSRGELDGLYLLNADPHARFSDNFVADCMKLKLLVIEDLLESLLSEKAHFVLAGGAWAEKVGTFVNHQGLAQSVVRGLRGPGDARPDGRILWELNGRSGLFRATTVRQEIAREIPAFAPLILGDLGDDGVPLSASTAPAETKQLQPA